MLLGKLLVAIQSPLWILYHVLTVRKCAIVGCGTGIGLYQHSPFRVTSHVLFQSLQ